MQDGLDLENEANESINWKQVFATGMLVLNPSLKHLVLDSFPKLVFAHLNLLILDKALYLYQIPKDLSEISKTGSLNILYFS